jgi:hypothetical protein
LVGCQLLLLLLQQQQQQGLQWLVGVTAAAAATV